MFNWVQRSKFTSQLLYMDIIISCPGKVYVQDHSSLQKLSASIRFPGLGADNGKVERMDYSVMVPLSASESW